MYYCKNCKKEFEKPYLVTETHGLPTPPYEKISVCPYCKQTDFDLKAVSYCRCCGKKLSVSQEKYCSDRCRLRGERLWQNEIIKRKLDFSSPLFTITRELDNYNNKNHTSISYGEYVAIVRPKLMREKRIQNSR